MEAILSDPEPVRVKRKTLQTVLEQCQRALELINNASDQVSDHDGDVSDSNDDNLPSTPPDPEADQVTISFPFLIHANIIDFQFFFCYRLCLFVYSVNY